MAPSPTNPPLIDRRTVLRRSAEGAFATALFVGLAGCSSDSSPTDQTTAPTSTPSTAPSNTAAPHSATSSSSGAATASPTLPKHIPFNDVTPDIPAANKNAVDGFLTYPDPPINAAPTPPGDGSEITAMTHLGGTGAQPVPMDKNSWWKHVNADLNATVRLTEVGDDYSAKFATVVAGGSLPDLTNIDFQAPNLAQLLQATFADLTEYLAGDAIDDYPMLANFSSEAWAGAVFNNAIYGVPFVLLPLQTRLEARTDLVEGLGQKAEAGSAEEFLELCRSVTDAKSQRWAMVQPINNALKMMCGVPNQWRVENGKFTADIETDEYVRWLTFTNGMWKEGLFNPDSFANPQTDALFQGGHFAFYEVGGAGLSGTIMSSYAQADPKIRVAPFVMPKYDGGGIAQAYVGNPLYMMTGIRKKDMSPQRIKMLLRVLNFLAAPFGTTQYLDTWYGAEGADYTWKKGVGPTPTPAATTEFPMFVYLPGTPSAYYSPGFDYVTRNEAAYDARVGPTALPYPLLGLYSATASAKGATLNTLVRNACGDVIQGRKSVASWKSTVEDWRKKGGDAMRAEYEEQYTKLHG
jgi:putative aldouronate transport system substrate-binding protein